MFEQYVKVRDKRGVTNADVARATGISPTVFSDWKSGKSKPKVDKLIKLAKYFGVSLEYFINGAA